MSESLMTAGDTAQRFFDAYRRRDVPAMLALFAPGGVVEYLPLKLEGPATQVGPASWGVLIDAFPDLTNEVKSVTGDASGRRAFVEVFIGGRQAKDAFGIPNLGRAYWLRHLFVFAADAEGRIERVTAYWDSVDWYTQLGKTSLA